VALTELLSRTRRVAEDAAIGLVFPALFSLAVILISRFAGDIHLDTDAVLLGELAFAPFDRFVIFGRDLGPISLYLMAVSWFSIWRLWLCSLKNSSWPPSMPAWRRRWAFRQP
jgi:manganese/zinc/iron transport system permease protein